MRNERNSKHADRVEGALTQWATAEYSHLYFVCVDQELVHDADDRDQFEFLVVVVIRKFIL